MAHQSLPRNASYRLIVAGSAPLLHLYPVGRETHGTRGANFPRRGLEIPRAPARPISPTPLRRSHYQGLGWGTCMNLIYKYPAQLPRRAPGSSRVQQDQYDRRDFRCDAWLDPIDTGDSAENLDHPEEKEDGAKRGGRQPLSGARLPIYRNPYQSPKETNDAVSWRSDLFRLSDHMRGIDTSESAITFCFGSASCCHSSGWLGRSWHRRSITKRALVSDQCPTFVAFFGYHENDESQIRPSLPRQQQAGLRNGVTAKS